MKFKCLLTLTAIMIILFSLATVAAGENMTDEVSLQDIEDSSDVAGEKIASDETVDLSVTVNATPSYVNGKYNSVGSEVSWTVTVGVKGGTARNTKVLEVLSNNLQYISHNLTRGSYDPETGIWDVGDLNPSEAVALTIITKLKSAGTYVNKAYATTDSDEKDLLDNFAVASMKTGSSKVTSSIVETSADRGTAQHTVHQASMGEAGFVISKDRQSQNSNNNNNNNNNNNQNNNNNNNNNNQNNNNRNNQNANNNRNNQDNNNNGYQLSTTILKAISLENLFNTSDGNSDFESNPAMEKVRSIFFYDYFTIPVLIFCAFLVILAAMVGYDRTKSES